jgi:phosphoesterase RecJ-like protein
MASIISDIATALEAGKSFLLASHISPDGDAVGAMAAMGHTLTALGKKAVLYSPSGLPPQFSWLKLSSPMLSSLPQARFDWIVVLDCGDQRRGGQELEAAMAATPTVVIDHHLANPKWGALNWVDSRRSSTAEMVAVLARKLGVRLKGPLAEAVYLGLATDTGHFTFDNTTPQTLRLAASIISQGLRIGRINELILNQWSVNRIHLWGEVLGACTLHFNGQLGVIRVTLEQLARLGATAADCDQLINFVLRIQGTKVALLLREEPTGKVKISLRSVGEVNIQAVAAGYGGGGHRNAAGAAVAARMADLEPQLIAAAGQALEES